MIGLLAISLALTAVAVTVGSKSNPSHASSCNDVCTPTFKRKQKTRCSRAHQTVSRVQHHIQQGTDDDVLAHIEDEAACPDRETATHRSCMLAKKYAKRWVKFVKTRKDKRAMAERKAARLAASQAKKNATSLLKASEEPRQDDCEAEVDVAGRGRRQGALGATQDAREGLRVHHGGVTMRCVRRTEIRFLIRKKTKITLKIQVFLTRPPPRFCHDGQHLLLIAKNQPCCMRTLRRVPPLSSKFDPFSKECSH